MVGRGNGRRAPASRGNAMVAVRRLQHQLTGFKFTPSEHPKTFVQIPWNSWTFEQTASTAEGALSLVVTVGDIQTQIRNKCATKLAADGNQLLVKVQTACGWVTAASLVYPDLEAVFYELSSVSATNAQSIRSQQRDKGTLNLPAKAGFSYPLGDQKEILGNDDSTTKVMSALADSPGSIITVRVTVLWQSTS